MISNDKQLPLRLLGVVGEIKDLPYEEVSLCNNPYQAVRLCIRGKSHDYLAKKLGMPQGTFTNIVNRDKAEKRPRNFDLHLVGELQALCGNRAISQYFDLESKGMLRYQQRPQLTIEEKAALYDQEHEVKYA